MFTRNISFLLNQEIFAGETTFDFVSLGGNILDAFPFFTLSMNNISEAGTYDFETEEVSQVATIKYLFNGAVVRKDEMTDSFIMSPLLIMQDIISPVAYVYPDDTDIEYPDEPQTSKSGKQEINYNKSIRLPAIQVEEDGVPLTDFVLGGIARYAIKGNWHFFANSIICDTVSIFVRRRIKTGLVITAYNFL